jgi:tetratricopeptide (TPR) repeat protein
MNQKLAGVNPRFLQQIANAVHYWLGATQQVDDSKIAALDRERTTIVRVLDYSLKVDSLVCPSAELIRQVFKLIEQRTYWFEWIPIVTQALAVLPPEKTLLRAQLLNQIGFLQRLCLDYDASLNAHHNALALCQQANHVEERNISYLFLANTHFDQHQFERSQQYGMLALSGFEAQSPPPDAGKFAAASNLLGLVASQRGAYEESLPLFRQAIVHWGQTEQAVYLARTWCNIADALTWLGTFKNALASYTEAEQALAKTNSVEDLILVKNGRGTVYYEMEAWEQAKAAYVEANGLAQTSPGLRYWQAVTAVNLADVFIRQGQWVRAESLLHVSLESWGDVTNAFVLAHTQGLLATVHANQGKVDEALPLYKAAIAKLANYPNHEQSCRRRQELVSEMRQWAGQNGDS